MSNDIKKNNRSKPVAPDRGDDYDMQLDSEAVSTYDELEHNVMDRARKAGEIKMLDWLEPDEIPYFTFAEIIMYKYGWIDEDFVETPRVLRMIKNRSITQYRSGK